MSGLSCYQQVLDDNALQSCNSEWDKTQQILEHMTSYTFYCEPENSNTIELQKYVFWFDRILNECFCWYSNQAVIHAVFFWVAVH